MRKEFKKKLVSPLGIKYKGGQHYYMKHNRGGLHENDEVIVVNAYKRGKKTYVDVKDIHNNVCKGISVIHLRKRRR